MSGCVWEEGRPSARLLDVFAKKNIDVRGTEGNGSQDRRTLVGSG